MPNAVPSHDTIQMVISILNPNTLYSETINYLLPVKKISLSKLSSIAFELSYYVSHNIVDTNISSLDTLESFIPLRTVLSLT